ncbi:hypothetical protein DQ04_00111310 [Trypanosoma grayi]|uniref:hypothetical protein n=1 Tax=Trypanosoma grayi TaxID=71804 RepID=UPI0004F47E9B|nr:hypothetical protein DQ04_00111310 [Trypanosoma grayi]KEG15331.1 hypothetical protein DQ04_00111310 [Trypanosoma grayi]
MEFHCRDGPPRRFYCANRETYRGVWPCVVGRRVPAARSLFRWAARNGAAVHCALRLHLHKGRGCCLRATRSIPIGHTLVSVPLALSLAAAPHSERANFAHRWDPLEELTSVVARELHNPRGFFRRYLEFLHDVYYDDDNDDLGADIHTWRASLREEIDTLYMGNSPLSYGVPNAPFLPKNSLSSASQRVEWVRLHYLLRQIEQTLPHFAAKSAVWAMSMVLSRALSDDQGGLALYPIIDFCLHSFEPNTVVRLTHPASAQHKEFGVGWHDTEQPCAHLVTRHAIEAGEALTLTYCPRRVFSTEDAEYWKLKWGFVPE